MKKIFYSKKEMEQIQKEKEILKKENNLLIQKSAALEKALLKKEHELEDNSETIVDTIIKILKMDVDTLKKNNDSYTVHQTNVNSTKFSLFTNICSFGGCDFNEIVFSSEKEALQAACIYKKLIGNPDCSCACPDCYQEYIQNCI